jgi:hypothetical protein
MLLPTDRTCSHQHVALYRSRSHGGSTYSRDKHDPVVPSQCVYENRPAIEPTRYEEGNQYRHRNDNRQCQRSPSNWVDIIGFRERQELLYGREPGGHCRMYCLDVR